MTALVTGVAGFVGSTLAARLQECQAKNGPPVLIRIETKAGHGAGTALTKVIDEHADELAFLVKVLGMEGT